MVQDREWFLAVLGERSVAGTQIAVTNGAMTTTWNYDDAGQALSESYTGGPLDGLSVANGYDALLRRTNVSLLDSSASVLTATAYGYDADSRLATVSDGTNTAAYSYVANSPLVGQIVFTNNGTLRMTTTKQYDYLNRLTQISSTPNGSGATPVSFNYNYNTANQRTAATNTDNCYWVYQYDSLGQVVSGKKYWADGTPVAGQQFTYNFDDIGNRTCTASGGDATGSNLRTANYTANSLNQYTSRDVPGYVDVLGSANPNATVTVNLQRAIRQGGYFWDELGVSNASSPLWLSLTNLAVLNNGTNADIVATNIGNAYVPQTPQTFAYDADGNLTNDGRWRYVWDAENRLVQMTVITNVGPQYQLTFVYDFQGRRIQKMVSTNDGTAYIGVYTNVFAYDDWNLIAVLNPQSSLLQSFMWGMDLSGMMQGAGGVGGLLSMAQYNGPNAGTYFYAYDGNGNVSTLVSATGGSVSAQYEYGPFGEVIRSTGPMAEVNPFRFSTKYQDDETGLCYYGYRYDDPSTGRWINRDPSEEDGGIGIYAFVANDPADWVDSSGTARRPSTGNPNSWSPYHGTAGQDVTDAVNATLAKVDRDWQANPDKHCRACFDLVHLPMAMWAWDITTLKDLGKDGTPIEVHPKQNSIPGTGDWARTVQFRYGHGAAKVYWGGAVNYMMFGKAMSLCYAQYPNKRYSLWSALNKVTLWKAVYLFNQMDQAQAFTEYGYYGTSPESTALPLGYITSRFRSQNHYADPNNKLLPGWASNGGLTYQWKGLNF